MRILVVLLLSSFFFLPQLMKKTFKMPPAYEHLPSFNPQWDFPKPDETTLSILNGPFTYLANGNQSTVFESQDKQYVLKIFRYSRSRFPIVHNFKNLFKKQKKMNLQNKITKTLSGAYLACTDAKDFTLCVYGHLNLSKNTLPKAQLIFPGGKRDVALDRIRFVLQKKVTPFKEMLLSAREDPEQMRLCLASFYELLVERSKLNIRNSDPNLGPNFGFIGVQAVEIDFGNYHTIPPNPQVRRKEISGLLNRLETWLNKHAPEYIPDLKDLQKKNEMI